jgi:hypothetical protein
MRKRGIPKFKEKSEYKIDINTLRIPHEHKINMEELFINVIP